MQVQFTKSEIVVAGSHFFPRAELLPEIAIKAYWRSYPQRTQEEKIEAYKQPAKWMQKLKFNPDEIISDYLVSN